MLRISLAEKAVSQNEEGEQKIVQNEKEREPKYSPETRWKLILFKF